MWPDPGVDAIVDLIHGKLLDHGESDSAVVRELVLTHDPLLEPAVVDAIVTRITARVDGYDVLDPLLTDPGVDEVMVNGDGEVWIERSGRLEHTSLEVGPSTTLAVLERIIAPLGLRIDRTSPFVDARLSDGSRVHAVIPPLAIDGPCLTIRRFGARRLALDEIATAGVCRLLEWAVRGRMNIVISGGAGAGKTTLLNAVASSIPDTERVITIEDAAELRLPGRHVVRLEARPANAEGAGEVRVRELLRNSLRMRPDRIVVGEVRSGEAIDMLQAMNTGHDGSLSTCHANSPADAIRRLETLVLMGDVALPLAAVREQLRAAIDLVVHVARRPDGSRSVMGIVEIEMGGESGAPIEVQDLTDPEGRLMRLPTRRARSVEAGSPDPRWVGP